jgi:hypothetical protein
MRHDLCLANVLRLSRGFDARGQITSRPAENLTNAPKSPVVPGVPSMALDGMLLQDFTIGIVNTAGTLQHRLLGDSAGNLVGAYASRVNGHPGHSGLINMVTNLSATQGFSGVGGIWGATGSYVLNTEDQPEGKLFGILTQELQDGAILTTNVYLKHDRRNVNGVVRRRPEFVVTNDMTGAAQTINTVLLPSTRRLHIRFFGFLA